MAISEEDLNNMISELLKSDITDSELEEEMINWYKELEIETTEQSKKLKASESISTKIDWELEDNEWYEELKKEVMDINNEQYRLVLDLDKQNENKIMSLNTISDDSLDELIKLELGG